MIKTLQDLLISQVRDLYDAEKRNLALLSKLQAEATNEELKNTLANHLQETDAQTVRLKEACSLLGVSAEGKTCEATKGLVKEAMNLISETDDAAVKDAAIIVSAQRIEHYEIASYGSAAAFAEVLQELGVANLLNSSKTEEKAADKKLNKLATGGILSAGLNEAAVK